MKKLAIILALLLVPMVAFGMDTISDSDLEAVTGQAGVTIALNSICIQNSAGTTSYGDMDSSKWIAIVGSSTQTRTIGFHSKGGSFDALTIDIVDITDMNEDGVVNLRSLVVTSDMPSAASNAAVKIELCDVIQIEESQGAVKHIRMAGTYTAAGSGTGDEIIATYSTAGTTRIIGADMGTRTISTGTGNVTTPYFAGENTTILISAHGNTN
jgi:spore coat protein U-like protein